MDGDRLQAVLAISSEPICEASSLRAGWNSRGSEAYLSISLSKISSPKYPWSLGTLPEDPRWGRRSKEEQTKALF